MDRFFKQNSFQSLKIDLISQSVKKVLKIQILNYIIIFNNHFIYFKIDIILY